MSALDEQGQPDRGEALTLPQLQIIEHPLAGDLMTRIRDRRTGRQSFADLTAEITRMLVLQALRGATSRSAPTPTQVGGDIDAPRLAESIAAVAILRAGLGMVPPLTVLLPDAPIYQVGVQRDEQSLMPTIYTANLPPTLNQFDRILLLDPMLATGDSACAATRLIRERFTGRLDYLGLIGAPIGVLRLATTDPEATIHLAALDSRLNSHGFIVPGLGDAGDRLFGTS